MNTAYKQINALIALGALSVGAIHVNADLITFDTTAEFDNNFVEQSTSGDATISFFTFASTETTLRKTGVGAQSVIYDTSATGAVSSGTGGVSGSGANKYINSVVAADVRASIGTASVGLYSRVSDDYSTAYLGLVNYTSGGDIQFRIFDNANPSSSGAGTQILNDTFDTTTSPFNSSTFYTITFETTTIAGEVLLELSVSEVGGNVIASRSVTDTTTPLLAAGQVGFRAASTTAYIDNFSVIPEVGTFALFAGALSFVYVVQRRRT